MGPEFDPPANAAPIAVAALTPGHVVVALGDIQIRPRQVIAGLGNIGHGMTGVELERSCPDGPRWTVPVEPGHISYALVQIGP